MLQSIRRHQSSLKHALDGIEHTISEHPNFRFHLFATICTIILGVYFSIAYYEWMVLVFTINMILVAEMINTTIESMVNLITMEHRQDAKIAKDVSAGMVLVSSGMAVVIGAIIFVPKIINLL